MTDTEIIAEQTRRILYLENLVHNYYRDLESIYMGFYSIGGPLNDNKNKYNVDQLKELMKIAENCDVNLIKDSPWNEAFSEE